MSSFLLSIAPMIDWTYSHFRVFMRILAPQALIYTEMQTTGAIKFNPQRAFEHDPREYPLALQLGGSHPEELAHCARLAEDSGFQEVNLNLGCPSDKVQAGQFGACLMSQPDLVVSCFKAMKQGLSLPLTAKIRLGIDEQDSYSFFRDFAFRLVDAGVDKIIVHARKAWLNGLSPKENRTIPPINYDYVYRLKEEVGDFPLIINGNIQDIAAIKQHLNHVEGVMLGRLACDNPFALTAIHHELYPGIPVPSRAEAMQQYLEYAVPKLEAGISPGLLLKPIFNLVHGLPMAKNWKRELMACMQDRDPRHLDVALDWFFLKENLDCATLHQDYAL